METSFNRRQFVAGAAGVPALRGTSSAEAQGEEKSRKTSVKTILVIGAHMDDCEIGAGGLIAKALRQGHRVVVLNVASDYSTWRVTKGRGKDIRERLLAKAREMGVEKRFLDYGYQQVALDVEAMRRVAEVVVDVKPDIRCCTTVTSAHALRPTTERSAPLQNTLCGTRIRSLTGSPQDMDVKCTPTRCILSGGSTRTSSSTSAMSSRKSPRRSTSSVSCTASHRTQKAQGKYTQRSRSTLPARSWPWGITRS